MRGRLLSMLLKEFRQLAADWPISVRFRSRMVNCSK